MTRTIHCLGLPAALSVLILVCLPAGAGARTAAAQSWQQNRERLVARLRAVRDRAGMFGPAYTPIYRAILPWYEEWGGGENRPVDPWNISPDVYAAALADALEHGQNYVAQHPYAAYPACFEKKLPDGRVYRANYTLNLPAGFPQPGRRYPLAISLHGSGWIAHRISYGEGSEHGDPWIGVGPILESGNWQLGFLNAFLDELQRILPVDQDRVYCSGHSLGAMATWNWAMSNPERFAAICPQDGVGQPYRAARLRYVPAWVVHGEKDETFVPGLADQMVSAIRAAGGTSIYSVLKGAGHNTPPWFNNRAVLEWFMTQRRSRRQAPPDPRDALRLDASGFSAWTILQVPAGLYWKSGPITTPAGGWRSPAANELLGKAEGRDILVDSPIRTEIDPAGTTSTLYLRVPLALWASSPQDASMVSLPEREVVRFYYVGTVADAARHARETEPQLPAGRRLSGKMWVTQLGPRNDDYRSQVSECWCELTPAQR